MKMKSLLAVFVCAFVKGMDNGLGRTPPLGWNTWLTCGEATCGHDNCNEEEVKSAALAMKQNGMHELGWNYVNLDDCWALARNSTDQRLMWDSSRFPSGIPALTEWLHNLGFKFGLYTSAGNQTCSSGGRPIKVPGSRGHYDLDAKTFADWGVDYIKLDWCGDIKDQVWEGKTAHEQFSAAVNQSGRAMFLEVVAGFFFLGADTVHKYANSWRFCEDHHDAWSSTVEQLQCRADQKTSGFGAPGGWPYQDFLVTGGAGCKTAPHCPGEGQSDDSYRAEFTLWSLVQSPLIVATDVRNMTPVMTQALLNEEMIQIHQNTTTPPGSLLGVWTCTNPLNCQIWGRCIGRPAATIDSADIATKSGNDAASTPLCTEWMVALLNTGDTSHSITAKWSLLGWQVSQKATVRDLWAHTGLPDTDAGEFTAKVAPHGVVAVKLTASN
jgi:alpha-galactosidase